MKVQYRYKATLKKRKKRIDWKKYIISILIAMLIANFSWDAYNRIPEIQTYSNKYYSKTLEFFKQAKAEAFKFLNKDKEE